MVQTTYGGWRTPSLRHAMLHVLSHFEKNLGARDLHEEICQTKGFLENYEFIFVSRIMLVEGKVLTCFIWM